MKKNNKSENNINIKNQSENSSKEPTPDSPLKQNTDQESPRTPKRKYHNSDNDNQGLTISPHTPKQKSTGSNDNNKEKNLSPHTPENKIQTNNLFGQQAKANSRFKTTNSRRKLQTPLSISSGNYEITTPPTTPTGKRKSTIQPDLLKAPKKKRKTSEENRRYREKFLEIEDKNREEELLELKAFYQKQVDTILSSQTLLNQYAQKVTKYLKTIDDGFQIFIYNSEQLRIVEYDITDSILDIGHYDHYFHIVKLS